ncbi:MAG: DUF1298 domain-containing protein [Rhodocyclaceae bacterium]|nr:DUF1298 domain-containing protein [Rhodocyclaceae bacterium]
MLLMESPRTPYHLSALVLFDPPPGAAPDFARKLHESLRSHSRAVPPFNFQLTEQGAPVRATPAWREVEHIDTSYHLPYVELAEAGSAGLQAEIARLEAVPLERTRPLWQCVFVDGLGGGRFAWYIKLHMCLLDLLVGVGRLAGGFSAVPRPDSFAPFWALAAKTPQQAAGLRVPGLSKRLAQQVQALSGGYGSLGAAIARSALQARQTVQHDAPDIPAVPPGTASRHDSNVRVARTFALDESCVARIAAAADTTADCVLLALWGGALRRRLIARDALPEQSLTVCTPVDLARMGRTELEFRMSAAVLPLATDVADPAQRLFAIHAAMAEAGRRLRELSHRNLEVYTGRLLLPFIVRELSYDDEVPPLANLSFARLPGLAEAQYFGTARVAELYQLPSLLDGQFLGIGAMKYAGQYAMGMLMSAHRDFCADELVAALFESCDELAGALDLDFGELPGAGNLADSMQRRGCGQCSAAAAAMRPQ